MKLFDLHNRLHSLKKKERERERERERENNKSLAKIKKETFSKATSVFDYVVSSTGL